MSLMDSGNFELCNGWVNMETFFNDIVQTANNELTAHKKGGAIAFASHFNEVLKQKLIYTDEVRLKEILFNLLQNAFKYTNAGYVKFHCDYNESGSGNLLFTVEDTGIGIPEPEKQKVFDRFFKGKEGEIKNKGTGLGLSIVSKLVAKFNGTITFNSEHGKGTIFKVLLPVEIRECNDCEKGKATLVINSNNKPDIEGKRILIVEDDQVNAEFLIKFLKKYKIETTLVDNGREALEIIKGQQFFDLVLMDMKLPVLNGYETTKEIKKLRSYLPVIAHTAFAQMEDRKRAFMAGCDDYLPKPLDKNDFERIMIRIFGYV